MQPRLDKCIATSIVDATVEAQYRVRSRSLSMSHVTVRKRRRKIYSYLMTLYREPGSLRLSQGAQIKYSIKRGGEGRGPREETEEEEIRRRGRRRYEGDISLHPTWKPVAYQK